MFIIAGIVLFVAAIVLIGAGKLFERVVYVETYFASSVQGIDVGTPIKCRGVKIGKVSDIRIVGDVYDFTDDKEKFRKYGLAVRVEGALEVGSISLINERARQKDFDILIEEEGLRFKMVPLGITGLSYLELDFGNNEHKPMDITWTPKDIYIPSVPNEFEMFLESAMTFSKIMHNDGKPLLENVRKASEQFPDITANLNSGLESVSTLADSLNQTADRFNAIFGNNQYTISETLYNLKAISSDLRDVTQELKHNPSRMLFGDPPPKGQVPRGE